MKQTIAYILLIIFFPVIALSQKPPIDTSDFNKWTFAEGAAITRNGEYLIFTIRNQPLGKYTNVLKSSDGKWIMEIVSSDPVQSVFSYDSKKCIIRSGDTARIYELGTKKIITITGLASYTVCGLGNKQCIAYTRQRDDKRLNLLYLTDGHKELLEDIVRYEPAPGGNSLLLHITDNGVPALQLYDIGSFNHKTIWRGKGLGNIVWTANGKELAFSSKSDDDKAHLFYYRTDWNTAKEIDSDLKADRGDFYFSRVVGITGDAESVLLEYRQYEAEKQTDRYNNVNILTYKDRFLPAENPSSVEILTLVYSYHLNSKVQDLVKAGGEDISFLKWGKYDTLAFVSSKNWKNDSELKWNQPLQGERYLVSLNTGKRRAVAFIASEISPANKFLIASVDKTGQQLSYNLKTGDTYNISSALIKSGLQHVRDTASISFRIMAWKPEDEALLVADGFDLWEVDPTGRRTPVNLTNGYGRRNNIQYLLSAHQIWDYVLRTDDNTIILEARNIITKESGFYRSSLSGGRDPEKLRMDAAVYGGLPFRFSANGQQWAKHNTQKHFIISRQTTSQSLNYYLTSDFKTCTQVSNNYPEAPYNWLTSELMYLDSTQLDWQAIIYKPENFDPQEKYPVIFYCYEEMSGKLNEYLLPELFNGGINIPWFVSRGYVVCTPDIFNNKQQPGISALMSVQKAYEGLTRFDWFDPGKVGIVGHSFGGYETNYILTHTNIFSAGCSAAGFCDLVSFYGTVTRGGMSNSGIFERGQINIGGTPWNRREAYLENSPILHADQLTTPLLIVHNKGDVAVPFSQGLEFFTALRRMGKKTWMLEYPGEGHLIDKYENQVDFTIRLTQFFDHYLKQEPLPLWMSGQVLKQHMLAEKSLQYNINP